MNFRILSPTEVARSYKQIELSGKDSNELLITLYETFITHLRRASRALNNSDAAARGTAVGTAIDLLGELRQSLDFEKAAEFAVQLDQFYLKATQELLLAHSRADVERFRFLENQFSGLLEVWKEVLPSP